MFIIKNRKILWISLILIIALILIAAWIFRPMTMKDIYDKPSFEGTVEEVHENSILVLVSEGEDELKSSDKLTVSLDVKLKDSMTSFKVGNTVKVYYDGSIAESYPGQVNNVYAIILVNE